MSAQPKNTSKVIYTARVRTDGNRDGGVSRSDDGRLEVHHSPPGKAGQGTNPEQLLAAGWAACFHSAMGIAARDMKVAMPMASAIEAEVDIVVGGDGYSLQARFNVLMPGIPRELAQSLIDAAHRTCPYSKALRGIPMEITLA